MARGELVVGVIGGGIVGARMALCIRRMHPKARVILWERESGLLERASMNNQARIHGGYHYPRSMQTALAAQRNYRRFVAEFPEVVVGGFKHYYAVAKDNSEISSSYFRNFCNGIGAVCEPAPAEVRRLFDRDRIEDVFEVEELVFSAAGLRKAVYDELQRSGIDVCLSHTVKRLTESKGRVEIEIQHGGQLKSEHADLVLNCTYSNLNSILQSSALEPFRLRHQLTEMALVTVPTELNAIGITVMCGPFFSLLPYPDKKSWTLSHVRYTPHKTWYDDPGPFDRIGVKHPPSNIDKMKNDAARFVPVMSKLLHEASIWEVKTTLRASETNDSRPFLLAPSPNQASVYNILGAKIDSVFDCEEALEEVLRTRLTGHKKVRSA